MAKNLVIVESPAKAKTIEKYLGKDYTVKSSYGHIRDLPKKGINIDIENSFKPNYAISDDKKKVVAELRKAAKTAEVWLASDEDREGEAIAWHLCEALGLDAKKTKRIVFHEITKSAIEAAVKNPRTVNQDLVDAQQARRILDRLVGYELSPVLWKKVRPGLSAGRVQSVAVRLLVERDREIRGFTPVSSFKVTGIFDASKHELPAELGTRFDAISDTKTFLEACKTATFSVSSVEQKPSTRNPGVPFTTSSLQQEAARRLGFSVKQTMTLAQRLYENGHITYMRTDSISLSQEARDKAQAYIKDNFDDSYYTHRQFKTKNENAQEAHEAIRPTNFSTTQAGDDGGQQKLYELIWKRTLSSQMSPAKLDRTEVKIAISSRKETFVAKGEVLRFDGFLKVYGGGKDDVILPDLSQGQDLKAQTISAKETFSKPPARYSEASLVKKLEELGIGRPSTYAPTISTIQTRGYVEKLDLEGNERSVILIELADGNITETKADEIYGADRSKLIPTSVAEVTTDFLVKHFAAVVDYDFTARAEEDFDHIANGKQSWEKMLKDFYAKFHPLVDKSESVTREETSQARELGPDPKTKKPIIARFGRYGPMLQMGKTESEEKPQFAPMPPGVRLEAVTLEQALEMFKLPRLVGQTEDGRDIKANLGRFGPYIQVDKTYASIKPLDPREITLKEARDLFAKKLEADAKKHINEFEGGIKILQGPYGPYITNGKKNVRIAKDVDPKKITEAEAEEMIAKAPIKKRRFTKKKAKK